MTRPFVSALGPNVVPTGANVRFYFSMPTFAEASAAKLQLDAELDVELTTAIYRLFYDRKDDEFFSSRQDPRGDGEQLLSNDPNEGSPALAYELFGVPKDLLNTLGQPEQELRQAVGLIFKNSNSRRPGGVFP